MNMVLCIWYGENGILSVVGGAEGSSQVVIGSLFPGCAAQMDGVIISGDRLVSVNGFRVVGARHKKVSQLMGQEARPVGQVALGLQSRPEVPVNGGQRDGDCPTFRDEVEVVVPWSQRNDGFSFFITSQHPSGLANGDSDPGPSNKFYVEGNSSLNLCWEAKRNDWALRKASLWVLRQPMTSTSDSVSVEIPVTLSHDSRDGQGFNQMPLVV
ncbi:hypothetical protein EG68_03458 [Paragonimus skrjabini miyazakii]|uniref:PDZ domain-containing protein n=1 Tax=Paragonimus skrjabini miyazakii TaxID=59628 RepID=A0A8S9YXT7_9TREM|nr:hypothetical protein EG68_03458 [Paragonimus skrjabini miyazakii]